MIDKLKRKLTAKDIPIILLFLSMLFLTRQFPFTKLGRLSSYVLVISFIIVAKVILENFIKLNDKVKWFVSSYVILITLLLLKSVFINRMSISYSVHTYITCMLLIIAFLYPKEKKIVKIFIITMLIHSVVLILLELYMIINSSPEFNTMVRNFILNNGHGDLYTRDGFYFRIIIKGNELLPVAFLIMYKYKSKVANIIKTLFALAIVISGNLAYFMAIAMFMVLYDVLISKTVTNKIMSLFELENRKILAIIAICLVVAGGILYKPVKAKIENVIALKSEYSLPTRVDQIEALIGDMDDMSDFIFGKGLGSTINTVTEYRDYTGDRYFEMQFVYVFYQIGIIAFTMLIILSIVLALKYMNKKLTLLIYFIYLVYGMTNPYTFNLTHIIIIILLTSYNIQLVEEEKS